MRVICEHCNKEGFIPAGITAITCPKCKGVGWFPLDMQWIFESFITELDVKINLESLDRYVLAEQQLRTLYEQNT